jgi:hypothetical protein
MLAWLMLVGCSPTHNWRSVGFEGTPVQALLPCKPERAQREVPFLGPDLPTLTLRMLSCDVDRRTFAVSAVQVPEGASSMDLQERWQRASWVALKQHLPEGQPAPDRWSVRPVRMLGGADSQRWSGPALDHQRNTIQAHVQWQQVDGWLVQTALYGPEPDETLLETFLGGLKLR